MANKKANIRFEDKNVAYVNVDLETHELSGGVMDETTGIFYPVSGGSEGTTVDVLIPEQIPDADNIVTDVNPDIASQSYFILEIENFGWPTIMTEDEPGELWRDSIGSEEGTIFISYSNEETKVYVYDNINDEIIPIEEKIIAYATIFPAVGGDD